MIVYCTIKLRIAYCVNDYTLYVAHFSPRMYMHAHTNTHTYTQHTHTHTHSRAYAHKNIIFHCTKAIKAYLFS